MKHNLLKSVIISVILLMGVSNAYAETIMRVYCKQAQSWWKADGAAVGVYAWKNSNTNANYPGVRMSPVDGQADLWYADIDIDRYDKIIFTRVNASGTIADWGAKTGDLTIANNKNQYTISSSSAVWGDPGVSGSWDTYKPISTASLTASSTSTYVGNNVTLTPALASNKDANTYSSTAYTVNPATASVNGNTFTATAAGTYTVTATVTYYAKGCPTLTSTTQATATITVEAQHSVTISYKCGNNSIKSATTSSVDESTPKSITAPAIDGYKFANWTLGNGITNKSANTTTNPISITTKSSGTHTLTANYTEDLTSTWHIVGKPTSIFHGAEEWAAHDDNMLKKTTGASTASKGSLTIDVKTLANSDSYQFKVLNTNGTIWYGWSNRENYWVNRANNTTNVYKADNNNLYFIPDALGEYKFDVDWSSSNPSLKVTFPTAYTVTFDKGIGGSSVTAKYNSTSFNNETKVQLGKTVTFTQTASAGYTFKEWNTKSDGTGTKLSTNATYTHTVAATNSVYAIYTKNPDNIVYLKPSHSWKSENAQFAVKYGGTNHMMTEAEECCEEKYYKVAIPSQYSKFKFVRLSDNSTEEWNVTEEISVPTDGKNLYDMTKIYLKPNANWKSDGARFAAYFFVYGYTDSKKKWMSMLSTDEDGVFYCDIPTEHTFDRVALTRMNGAISDNEWNYRWNQTSDFNLYDGYNLYELQGDKWGKDNGGNNHDGMTEKQDYKWTTYNPTYSVTLEPTPYGHYTVEYNGRTYKSATDKNVVIENVALGATIRVSKGTPDNSAEYTDDLVLQKASGSGKIELKGGEYYDHTICGTTTITENFVTKNPHTVYLRVPTTVAEWYDEGYATPGANCVYYTHILGGGIKLMEDVTGTIKGEDGYNYYQLTIPAGYRTFCFQYKSGTKPESYTPRNYTANFTHAMPFNGLNCFTILGSNDDDYYYGEWGTLLQNGDYRLLYVEQVVEKDANGNTVITRKKAHPSDVVKASEITQEGVIVSLHTYKERTYEAKLDGGETYTSSNNPEIILQRYDGSKWVDEEWHMVYGPLETLPSMGMLPGRRNTIREDLIYDNGIDIIKNDNHKYKGNGVWNFYIINNGTKVTLDLDRTHRYEGQYYIRTDAAIGGWNTYTTSSNHMGESEISMDHSNYSHYFCKWISNAGTNVKYTIANDYGMAISDTLEADATDIWGTPITAAERMVGDDQLLPASANVRFSWNEKSNFLHRAYLAGSGEIGNRFLVVEGEDNKILNADGQPLVAAEYNEKDPRSNLSKNEEIFNDVSNWVYYADVQLKPNAGLKVTAKYNNKVQYFVGQESNWNNTILKGEERCSDKYLIRLLYDFKTNELISAYVPGGQAEKEIEPIETNLMLIRKENDVPKQLSFNENNMKDVGKRAYGVLELTQATLEDNTKNVYVRSLYWISFPFDVRITDIFGFGEYGKHWIIQSYDGAKRAREGLWSDSETNWVYHFDPNTLNADTPDDDDDGIMKKGVGYVVALNLKNIQAESPFVGRITTIALYFPSTTTITGHIVNENAVSISVPEHVCTINRPTPKGNRTVKDSHWNVIGVPSYINAVGDFSGKISTIAENVPFYYRWLGDYDKYQAVSGKSGVPFNSLNAYMVQFAGNLQWTNVLNERPAGMAAKRNSDNMQEHHLCLELQQNGNEQDRTFIQLQEDEVTTAFDFNYDLCKIINKGANIYSLIATDRDPIEVAGNVLPVEEAIIPLGIQLDAAGEYTFAMPEGTDGIVVELIDYETNTRTNMLLDEYTVNLGKGTFESRFALHVKPDKTTTSVDHIGNEATGDKVKKFLIDGVLYMQKDGVLYDAQGRCVQ